jgi:hypothetical protein
MEQFKTVVLLLLRWSLKFYGGFLAVNGVSEEAFVEVIGGLLMALIGVIISLVTKKKDLATPPPG